ncbi:TetR/AcrR family transcriptional regulator [Streptomyces avermitilis]|uniref:TetR/AcrR family transcriptional regulator n=1 Tax=Streptomyces avermitilis TaxID=33903 RepID=UPI003806F33D
MPTLLDAAVMSTWSPGRAASRLVEQHHVRHYRLLDNYRRTNTVRRSIFVHRTAMQRCTRSTMGQQTLGRRARLRIQTTAEIKATALRHMAEGGPDAISLRAIARDMQMSGSAIHSYFDTRDALITELINDVYTALVDHVEAARDALPTDNIAGRILAWATARRDWSLANPQGFRLIYGDPVPGYQTPEGGPAPEAAKRACLGLTGLAAAAWPYAETAQDGDHGWEDFAPELVDIIRRDNPALPPAGLALALRLWGHGGVLTLMQLSAYVPERIDRNGCGGSLIRVTSHSAYVVAGTPLCRGQPCCVA